MNGRFLKLFLASVLLAGVDPAWGTGAVESVPYAPETQSIVQVKHLTVEHTVWRYETCGAGDEVAMLLTGGIGSGVPGDFVQLLARRYRVIVPDYPPVQNIDGLIRGMVVILEHEGAGRTHLLGSSLGGMIAQCFVRQHRQRVESVVLANTSGPIWWAAPMMKGIRYALYVIPFPVLKPPAKWCAVRLIRPSASERRSLEGRLDRALSRAALITLVRRLEDFHRRRFTQVDLEDWKGRMLIIESDDDPGVPKRHRKRLTRLYPQASVRTFHGGGHAPSISHREELLGLIREFMVIE